METKSPGQEYADWKSAEIGGNQTETPNNANEISDDEARDLLEKGFEERFHSDTPMRLGEAKDIGGRITETFHGDRQRLLKLSLSSPDLVNRFISEGLNSIEASDLVNDLTSYAERLTAYIRQMSEKFNKNHAPNESLLIESESVLRGSPELVNKLNAVEINGLTDPTDRFVILSELTDHITLLKDAVKILEKNASFYEKISSHIDSKASYYHVSSIEESGLSDGATFDLSFGNGAAWGRGVYASEKPLLHYLGGETTQKEMSSCVIFSFPVDQDCIFNQGSAEGAESNLVNVNTNGRVVKFERIIKRALTRQELQQLNPIGLENIPDGMQVFLVSAENTSLIEQQRI